MPDPAAPAPRPSLARIAVWLPIAFGAGAVAVAAFALLFSTFMLYDDEGYVLFSLQLFVDGGGLYDRVYTQYGPFFFLFHQGLHALGLPFTNTGARLLTFVYWLGAAGFSAALVWRVTRSTPATVFTLAGVFLHLWPMISEPSHPGGLIVFSLAALAWCGVAWSNYPARLAVAGGALAAALFLTKINVGIFAIASIAIWGWLRLAPLAAWPRLRTGVAAVALALLPAALMRTQLHQGWVATFALIAGAAGLGTVLALARASAAPLAPAIITRFATAGLLLAAGTCLAITAQGTSLSLLLEGVLLGPLRHPQVYSAFVKWREGALPVALASLLLVAVACWRPNAGFARLAALGRLAAAGTFLLTLTFNLSLNSHAFALSFALSTIAWFAYPLGGDSATQPARTWLALLVVVQALHAFPVAGSQISWGTFLWIPLAAVGARDAWDFLLGRAALATPWLRLVPAAITLVALINAVTYARTGLQRIQHSDSLRLPGAESLRLPENFTTTLRVLSENAAAHADVLFSLPGMHSFHRWTGVPAPTSHNATHWFTLLTPEQQDGIRKRLAASPKACLILQRNVYDFLVASGVATESPLTLWLKENFERAFTLETYEFWVRKGRTIAPLGTAAADEAAPGTHPRYRLSLVLPASALADVAAVELVQVDSDRPVVARRWTSRNATFALTPLSSAGVPLGDTQPVVPPFAAHGLVRLELLTDDFPEKFRLGFGALYLCDSSGRRLAEARFTR